MTLGLALAATALLSPGCSSGGDSAPSLSLYPVKGKVVLEDGKPVTGGRVVLVSKDGKYSPGGAIGRDGSFTISSGPSGDGAPAGDYKVRIEPEPAAKKGGKPPFPMRYSDEDSSGLTITVKAEPNDVPPIKLLSKDDRPAQSNKVRD